MQRYIAFISGLPTGPKTIPQDTLRSLFTKLGFLNVETHSTTGNVAFETSPVGVVGALEAQVSRHLRRSAGDDDIWTFIRTPDELSEIAKNLPFGDLPDGAAVFVVLLNEPLDERTARSVSVRRSSADRLYPRGREIYWVRQSADDGGPPLRLGEVIHTHATLRSIKLVERLAERYGPAKSRRPKGLTESERSRL
ncbi:MAG: DUF1697 domain-containing protein [Gemmatimonadaceae bacterium]